MQQGASLHIADSIKANGLVWSFSSLYITLAKLQTQMKQECFRHGYWLRQNESFRRNWGVMNDNNDLLTRTTIDV